VCRLKRAGGLDAKSHPGPAPGLTGADLRRLGDLLAKGAKAHGWPNHLWTAARAARLLVQAFTDTAYHSSRGEVRPDWDYAGFAVLGGFALDVGRAVADADRLPAWNPGDGFRPARERSGVR
jgi:hypothetical protein